MKLKYLFNILAVIIIMLTNGFAIAEENIKNKKISFSTEEIAVKFKIKRWITDSHKQSIIENEPEMALYSERKDVPFYDMTIVKTKKGADVLAIKKMLNKFSMHDDIEFVSPVFRENDLVSIPSNQIIVEFAEDAAEDEIDKFNNKFKAQVNTRDFLQKKQYILELPVKSGNDILSIVEEYISNPIVKNAQPNYIKKGKISSHTTEHTGKNPNDPHYGSQWHLERIKAPQAWDITTGSGQIIIAIIDDGVDGNHPDLINKLNTGHDSTIAVPQPEIAGGDNLHATLVAGVAGAQTNNQIGIAGVGWDAKIVSVKIGNTSSTGELFTDSAKIIDGIQWAADHANILTNSWSFNNVPGENVLSNVLDNAIKNNVVIFSSGNTNENNIAYPGNIQNVITVGASDRNDFRVNGMSSWGSSLDLLAPGVDIYTTIRNGTYDYVSGTSFSAPIVAGVAALMLSIDSSLKTNAVEQIIRNTATDLVYCTSYDSNGVCIGENATPGKDNFTGYGLLNAEAAVQKTKLISLSKNPDYSYLNVQGDFNFEVYINPQGSYITKNFVVTVNSSKPSFLNGIQLKSSIISGGSAFSIQNNGCYDSLVLTSQNSCTITVKFLPVDLGSVTGALLVNYKDPADDSNQDTTKKHTVNLSGIGKNYTIKNNNQEYFDTLQAAYNDPDTAQLYIRNNLSVGSITTNSIKNVSIYGGYDKFFNYRETNGKSTLDGIITMNGGTLTFSNLTLQKTQ